MNDREAMQQALEALTVYDGTNGESKRKRVLTALRERLAQPEQEPAVYPDEAYEMGLERIAYYTTPPRRDWVGLTDEEKLHLEIMGGKSDVMLAEAIEAKLREKNA
jgi:hypothetical protein